jgi:hypothetical protein
VLQGKDHTERTDEHERYEAELGLPVWLAYLEDHIFEQLPNEVSRTWPRRFAEAIPVGAVVEDRVLARILHWLLASEAFGVRQVTEDVKTRGYIDVIATVFDAEANGVATADQREAAAWAARDARAAWDAWAARDAWAAWDARDARDARAAWAAMAAWDARAAWDAWDVWDVWDAAQPSAVEKKAPAYYPALSEFVLEQLRALTTRPAPGMPG